MNELIAEMNRILSGWKEFFSVKALDLEFKMDTSGTILLSDKSFVPEPDLKLKSIQYDAEHISYYFNCNCSLHIEFEWPEDTLPFVRSFLYSGPPAESYR